MDSKRWGRASGGGRGWSLSGGVNVDFRFCYATYLITTLFWENIFSIFSNFLEDHVEVFPTHVVRAPNSPWARRYSTSKLHFQFYSVYGKWGYCHKSLGILLAHDQKPRATNRTSRPLMNRVNLIGNFLHFRENPRCHQASTDDLVPNCWWPGGIARGRQKTFAV